MAKPPTSPPASDIEGAKQDEVRHVDAANDAGDLERARKKSFGRPEQDRDERNPDDRSW
jgi:hypothetical protein